MSLRESILNLSDEQYAVIQTPEWSAAGIASLRVKGLSAAELDDFEHDAIAQDGQVDRKSFFANQRARMFVRCVVDESGARMFKDDDAKAIGKRSAKVLDRVFEAANRLSGRTAKDIKELEKKSVAGQPSDST